MASGRSNWFGSTGRIPAWIPQAAAVWTFAFGMLHLFWALGGEFGLRFSLALEGQAETDLIADPAFRLQGLWGVVALCWLAAMIALASVRTWGERIPRWVRLIGIWGVAVVLLLRSLIYPGFIFSTLRLTGVVPIGDDADRTWNWWDLIVWSPWFLLGAVLFGLSGRRCSRHH